MATFYEEMAAMADELLREFGKTLTLQQIAPGQYDPAAGAAVDTVTDFPAAVGALFDYELLTSGQTFMDASLLAVGDKQCYLSPIGVPEPRVGFQVVDGAETWRVMSVKKVDPAGTPVLYELQLRK